mgnify:FL=1
MSQFTLHNHRTNSAGYAQAVANQDTNTRAAFITRTYSHLFGAITGFTLIEVFLFKSGAAESIARAMMQVNWLLILGAFVVVSWMARSIAHTSKSIGTQYAALAGFVFAEALIFVPLLYVANHAAPGVISSAAMVTLLDRKSVV